MDGWRIDVGPTTRAGISATRAVVETDGDPQPHRPWSTIDRLIVESNLPSSVADGSRRTFELLGRAEAGIHDVTLDEVHFHEVGAIDAIVDIVGAWSALDQLAVDEVVVGPVGLGHGYVDAAHGRLPVPAPATAVLLQGADVRGVDVAMETITPTGAALLTAMADRWGPIPSGRLTAVARGAGGRDPETHPNVLTALTVDRNGSSAAVTAEVLATNLDDATPEVIGHTIDRLLEAGVDDAWVVPTVMKKSRPGHELRVLCDPSLAATVRTIVFAETGTLGIRVEPVTKHVLERSVTEVEVRGHRIRVKVGPHRTKPEHDDLVAASRATGVPGRPLAEEALECLSGRRM